MMYENRQEVGDFICHTRIYPKPKHTCEGVTSICDDNQHVVLLDYDDCDFDIIIRDINHLVRRFGLGPFFIYQTGRASWHIRCPTKVSYQVLTRIISESHTDPYIFDEITGYKRKNTHRVDNRGERGAPVFHKLVAVPTLKEISRCHWDVFKKKIKDKRALAALEGLEKKLVFDKSTLDDTLMVMYGTAKGAEGYD